MFTDHKSQLSQLLQLRHELGIPINAIIGHSEMIIDEIAEVNQDVPYLRELLTKPFNSVLLKARLGA